MQTLIRFFPPVLVIRLLDDIHALAEFSTSFARRFDETIDLMDRMDRQSGAMMPLMEKALPLMKEGNRNMAAALPVMERIIPAVTQATFFTGPLEGAAARVGRVVERLPRMTMQSRGSTLLPSSAVERPLPEVYQAADS